MAEAEATRTVKRVMTHHCLYRDIPYDEGQNVGVMYRQLGAGILYCDCCWYGC